MFISRLHELIWPIIELGQLLRWSSLGGFIVADFQLKDKVFLYKVKFFQLYGTVVYIIGKI